MEAFATYFLMFVIYSAIGWIGEIFYVLIKDRKWTSRGFLLGPYCPIYGIGALLVSLLLTKFYDQPIIVFLLSMLICGALEYLTSFFMEKVFAKKWWDYKDKPFNLNGRVCLENLIYFGLAALLVMYVLNAPIANLIAWLNGAKIPTAIALALIMCTDLIITLINESKRLRKQNSSK